MKVKTTLRSFIMLIISAAAAIFVIFPFVEWPDFNILNPGTVSYPFYDLLKFEEFNLVTIANETLGTIREISSYLVIVVICAAGVAFLASLTKIVLFKSKFVGFIAGISYLVLTFSMLGLGACSIAYGFIFKGELDVLGKLTEGLTISTLGGWLYAGLGLLTPVSIALTNFIKK